MNNPRAPQLFQLWFQDEEGNVRLVVYDNTTRQLRPEARIIRRTP